MRPNNPAYPEHRQLAEDFDEVFRICEGFLKFDFNLAQVGALAESVVKTESQKLLAQRLIKEGQRFIGDTSVIMSEFPFENKIFQKDRPLSQVSNPLNAIKLVRSLLSISVADEFSEKEKFIRRLTVIHNSDSYISDTELCTMLGDMYWEEGRTEEIEALGRITRNLERGHELITAINFWMPSYVNILLQKARESKGRERITEAFETILELNLSLDVD